jgi:hypothetical protein
MQRWVTRLVGLAVVAFAIWLVARDFHPPRAIGRDPSPAPHDAGDGEAAAFALGGGDAGPPDDSGPLLLADLLAAGPRSDAGSGAILLDGSPVPPLPLNAPRQVRFGVVLVSYAGAQPSAAATSHPASRSRAEARTTADSLAAVAAQDFHAAVAQGDTGSADDVGHVKLGVLEPAPEYVLFSLPVDGVGGPIETPRGFWIVKRLE